MKDKRWVHTVYFCARVACIVLIILSITASSFAQKNPYAKGEIVALVYHRFGDDRYPSTNIKNETFRKQLEYLKQHNYHVMLLSDACSRLYHGKGVPEKTIVITIDDGYKSFIENGLPILEEYNYPASIFINTMNVGNGDYLGWDDLGLLINAGMEIGNHSHSHMYFLDENDEDRLIKLQEEIVLSQDQFAEHLDYMPAIFSYPFGETDEDMKAVIKDAGFKFAAAQNSGVISLYSDPFSLPRFPMNERYGPLESFVSKIQMHALPVLEVKPEDPFYVDNPPVLYLTIDPRYIDKDQIQCFIGGSTSCNMTISDYQDKISLKVESQNPLTTRRSLYTITAPFSKGKGWCWYSYVWVDPGKPE